MVTNIQIRQARINLLVFVVTLLICVILTELLLRSVFPLEHGLAKEHILTSYGIFSRPPNFQYTYARQEFTQQIKINSKSLRDYEYDYRKKSSVCRIAMVGDSFTEGLQVELEETMPKKLEKNLNQTGSFEVINFGFSGFGLIPEAVLIEEVVMRYAPDIIILNYYAGNDLKDIDADAYKEFPDDFWLAEKHEKLKEKVYSKDLNLELRNFLNRNSMIYVLAKRAVRALSERKSTNVAAQSYINPEYDKVYSADLDKKLNTTYLIFKFLNDFTRRTNATFIVTLIPTKEQVDTNIFTKILAENDRPPADYDLEKPQRQIEEILDSLKIPYVDLLPDLRKNNVNNTFYWEIDGHFNSKGYETAANLIRDALFSKKYLCASCAICNRP